MMRDSQILGRHFLSCLICLPCGLRSLALGIAILVLSNIAVVVGLHLLVEDLRLATTCLGNELGIQEVQDGVADLVKLSFHLAAVLLGILGVVLVALGLLLLLHAGDDAPCSPTATPC